MIQRVVRIGVAAFMAVFVFAVPVYAYVKSDDTIVIQADEVIDDDVFLAGSEVFIEGTVNGDVYVGANRLSVRGTVNGDVIVGANTIEVTGFIRDDLRAGGNSISLIGAEIGDSVTVGGNELSIDADTIIGGGLIFGGRLLSFDGELGRGIVSGAESTRIDGPVGSTVRLAATDIDIGDEAVINGNLEYRSDNEADIRGQITGEIIRGEGGGLDFNFESMLRGLAIGFTIWAFLAAAIIGGLFILLWPKALRKAHQRFVANPWPTVGWGTVVLLATIPAVILLFITIVGIPLALLVLLAWLVAIYFAKFFASYSVGQWLLSTLSSSSRRPRVYSALLIGLVLYYVLRMLPGVGVLVRLATTIVGLGMILRLYHREDKSAATTSQPSK